MSREGVVGKHSRKQMLAYAKATKAWRERHLEQSLQVSRASHLRRKLRVLVLVGKGQVRCVECGCDDPRVLEVNHINGGGRIERRNHPTDVNLYGVILRGERQVDDLNILCRVDNARAEVVRKFPELGGQIQVRWKWARKNPRVKIEGVRTTNADGGFWLLVTDGFLTTPKTPAEVRGELRRRNWGRWVGSAGLRGITKILRRFQSYGTLLESEGKYVTAAGGK